MPRNRPTTIRRRARRHITLGKRVLRALALAAVVLLFLADGPATPTVHAVATKSYSNFVAGFAGPVLSSGPHGAWDDWLIEKVWVIKDAGTYEMWYTGQFQPGDANSMIGYATSADGTSWTKYAGNPVVDRPSQDQDMSVVKVDATTYHMYIEVDDFFIDLLTSSDGISWTPDPSNPVKSVAASPVVWKEGATWYMLYESMVPPRRS